MDRGTHINKTRIALILVLVVLMTLGMATGVFASEQAEPQEPPGKSAFTNGLIMVNGVEINAPGPSVTEGVIMLPLRPIAEELGFTVVWHEGDRRIELSDGRIQSYVLWIGQALLSSDGGISTREFGPAPELIGGSTYVPLPLFNYGFAGMTATIEEGTVVIESDGFAIGSEAFAVGRQTKAGQPETVDEFVPVFAAQLRRYNQIAPMLWPDNAVVDQVVVLEDVDNARFWYIDPLGEITTISEADVDELGISRKAGSDDFSFFDGGMYITISEQAVREQLGADKLHVGSYDSILWLTHEGFHRLEHEDKWSKPRSEDIPNPGRAEFLTDISARAKRNLLQRQIMQAVAEPASPALILAALATYEDYKVKNADDHALTSYWERIEGTALYYEVASSLYIFYPEQVNDKDDLARAFASLAKHEDDYAAVGLVSEAYVLGAFTGALLDRLDPGWKVRIEQDPLLTPLELLLSHFEGHTLPEARELTAEELERVTTDIQERIRFLADRQVTILTMLKQSLDAMPADERAVMETYLESALQSFEEMILVLPQEEQGAFDDFINDLSVSISPNSTA